MARRGSAARQRPRLRRQRRRPADDRHVRQRPVDESARGEAAARARHQGARVRPALARADADRAGDGTREGDRLLPRRRRVPQHARRSEPEDADAAVPRSRARRLRAAPQSGGGFARAAGGAGGPGARAGAGHPERAVGAVRATGVRCERSAHRTAPGAGNHFLSPIPLVAAASRFSGLCPAFFAARSTG